ncbi:6543_t:CDS:1, partial [Cetraspora pellucida]
DDAIQPFGLIHKYGYFHKQAQEKISETLSTLLLVLPSHSSINVDNENSLSIDSVNENPIKVLEKKIDDLELFLRNHVVE